MNLLGADLEQVEIDDIAAKFPKFEGEIPSQAKFWSKNDLEQFLSSDGAVRPPETMRSLSCPLLTRVRQALAENKISEAPADYRALCCHLRERDPAHLLPSVAECLAVPRAERAPPVLKVPVVVPSGLDWPGRDWGLDFWKREYPNEWWKFRARSPLFSRDTASADLFQVEGSASEYIDYMRIVQDMDPKCQEDNSLAFPRLAADSWCPFPGGARALLERSWQKLSPVGTRDHTARWIKSFAAVFNLNWLEFLARFYKVTLGAPGCTARLHVVTRNAHCWYAQIEGRRLFFLFSPKESHNLYEESMRET